MLLLNIGTSSFALSSNSLNLSLLFLLFYFSRISFFFSFFSLSLSLPWVLLSIHLSFKLFLNKPSSRNPQNNIRNIWKFFYAKRRKNLPLPIGTGACVDRHKTSFAALVLIFLLHLTFHVYSVSMHKFFAETM